METRLIVRFHCRMVEERLVNVHQLTKVSACPSPICLPFLVIHFTRHVGPFDIAPVGVAQVPQAGAQHQPRGNAATVCADRSVRALSLLSLVDCLLTAVDEFSGVVGLVIIVFFWWRFF